MSKNKLLYEGKAKQLFTTDKDDQLIQITAIWNRERAETIQNDIAPYFN